MLAVYLKNSLEIITVSGDENLQQLYAGMQISIPLDNFKSYF